MVFQFRRLFSPLKIGAITVSNRIFMPAHHHRLREEAAVDYYVARAGSGVGLIVTSGNHVHRMTTAGRLSPIHGSGAVAMLAGIAEAIHKFDTRVIAQLGHRGGRTASRAMGGASYGPSPIARRAIIPSAAGLPHQMDIDEIREVIEAFAGAACNAREAGMDGVEIGAIYGFLIYQFLSPSTNLRTDEYGGSEDNRLRFALDIINAVRNAVGRDFTVGIRISGDEFLDGGLTFEDVKGIAARVAATGALDYISLCTGVPEAIHYPSMYFPLASFVYMAAAVKEIVDLPVFTAGRINDPVLAENILEQDQADMIGMVRALVADPDLPRKTRDGRLDEIRHCIGCNEGCVGIPFLSGAIGCTINPEAGKERELALKPAENKKKVMVVGGGAAGLEAARVAALRGHQVSLYEKTCELGGQLNIASLAPGRVDFAEVPRYYSHQMKLLKVDVHLETAVTSEFVLKQNPDAVVVATGSEPDLPTFPGIETAHVVEVRDLLQNKAETGKKALLIAHEHHAQGLSAAEFLADRGVEVEIISDALYVGSQLDRPTLEAAYTRLLQKGIIVTPLTRVKKMEGKATTVENVLSNAERVIGDIDDIVISTDGRANDELYRSLKGKVKELHLVGQCLSPRKLLDSIKDGARVGRLL
ncbi:FAD-dependent oxidoreductase [Chloroflexota bacterium]